jgi:hypothetical protein
MKFKLRPIMKIPYILGIMLMIGCVSTGSNFDEAKISQIKKGETTEAELVQMFGKPRNRTTQMMDSKVSTVLTWVYVKVNPIAGPFLSPEGKSKTLGVFLDSNGKVERVSYTGDMPAK